LRSLLVVAAALGSLTAPAALAQSPSFALWTVRWSAQDAAAQDKVASVCARLFGQSDAKTGACFAKGISASVRARQPIWGRQVVEIAQGKPAPCRRAIHVYWLASRRGQAATLRYLDSHQRVGAAAIAKGIMGEPYATLRWRAEDAKSRAIRVCG
jgi:hypothetical protein